MQGFYDYQLHQVHKEARGEKGVEECAKFIEVNPTTLKEGQWYPDAINDKIMEWIANTKGNEFIEVANRQMVQDLGLLSYIVRFMDIKTIFKKLPRNYTDVFNYGRVEVEFPSDKKAIVKIFDAATSKYSCPAWEGVFKGAFDMTATNNGKVVKKKCQLKGEPHCEWHLNWD
jgi:hypothetical protein